MAPSWRETFVVPYLCQALRKFFDTYGIDLDRLEAICSQVTNQTRLFMTLSLENSTAPLHRSRGDSKHLLPSIMERLSVPDATYVLIYINFELELLRNFSAALMTVFSPSPMVPLSRGSTPTNMTPFHPRTNSAFRSTDLNTLAGDTVNTTLPSTNTTPARFPQSLDPSVSLNGTATSFAGSFGNSSRQASVTLPPVGRSTVPFRVSGTDEDALAALLEADADTTTAPDLAIDDSDKADALITSLLSPNPATRHDGETALRSDMSKLVNGIFGILEEHVPDPADQSHIRGIVAAAIHSASAPATCPNGRPSDLHPISDVDQFPGIDGPGFDTNFSSQDQVPRGRPSASYETAMGATIRLAPHETPFLARVPPSATNHRTNPSDGSPGIPPSATAFGGAFRPSATNPRSTAPGGNAPAPSDGGNTRPNGTGDLPGPWDSFQRGGGGGGGGDPYYPLPAAGTGGHGTPNIINDGVHWHTYIINPHADRTTIIDPTFGTVPPWRARRHGYGVIVNYPAHLPMSVLDYDQFMLNFMHGPLFDSNRAHKDFLYGFPTYQGDNDDRQLLRYHVMVVEYCLSFKVYVPPLHTYDEAQYMGVWYNQLPERTRAQCQHFNGLLYQVLKAKHVRISHHYTIASIINASNSGYMILYQMAAIGGHPKLNDIPPTLSIPRQAESDTLSAYSNKWLYYLTISLLDGVVLSDRYYFYLFMKGMHGALSQLRSHLRDEELRFRTDSSINRRLPRDYAPDYILAALTRKSKSLGCSATVTMAPRELMTRAQPSRHQPRIQAIGEGLPSGEGSYPSTVNYLGSPAPPPSRYTSRNPPMLLTHQGQGRGFAGRGFAGRGTAAGRGAAAFGRGSSGRGRGSSGRGHWQRPSPPHNSYINAMGSDFDDSPLTPEESTALLVCTMGAFSCFYCGSNYHRLSDCPHAQQMINDPQARRNVRSFLASHEPTSSGNNRAIRQTTADAGFDIEDEAPLDDAGTIDGPSIDLDDYPADAEDPYQDDGSVHFADFL